MVTPNQHSAQASMASPAKQDFWHNKYNLQPRVTYDRAFHLVGDDNRAYFGSSADDQVRCLDMTNGEILWSFFAEGPVRLAPTLKGDRLLFGADDGFAYCLNPKLANSSGAQRPILIHRVES